MAQESSLVISIDARNAEKTAKALNEQLKTLEKHGNDGAKGIQKVGDEAKAQTSKIDGLKKSIIDFGNANKVAMAAIAGAVGGAIVGMGALAVETANQASELEKFAFRANTTTQEFQKMAVGAKAFGIEQEKLSDMMKDFNEKLGELTTIGAGGGVDFFEQIAVKTEGSAEGAKKLILEMQRLSGPEALQLYVNKLEEAGVTQQQMSFYLESMASDMTDLIPLLVNGGEGMKLYGDLAERAGIIMSDNTREAAKELKDQIYMLDLQMQGAKNQLMQAVIPAFVDIAKAFFDGSEQGVQFEGVANNIADGLRFLAKVAIGAATSIQVVGKAIGGIAATGAAILTGNIRQTQAIQDAMVADITATLEDAANRMDIIDRKTASTQAKQLRGIRELKEANNGVTKGLDELVTKQNKDTESKQRNTKATQDQTSVLREQQRLRAELMYQYASAEKQALMDLEEEKAKIRFAFAGDASAIKEYTNIAEKRHAAEAKLYEAELAFELHSYKLNEEQKLTMSKNIERMRIGMMKESFEGEKQLRIKALNEFHEYEIRKLKETRLRDAQERVKYDTANRNGTGEFISITDDRDSQISNSVQLFNASLESGLASREQLWQEHLTRVREINEVAQMELLNLQFSYGQSMADSMAGIFKTIAGEQSNGYKLMFSASKAFSIAQSALAIKTGIAQAAANPFPYNLVAMATVAAQTASIIADIKAIKDTGFKSGGYTGNMGTSQVAGVVHGQEYVLNAQATKRIGVDNLNALNNGGSINGGVNVIINVPQGYKAVQTQDQNGVTIDVVEDMITRSWANLNKPNSQESRALQNSYGLQPSR